MNAPFKAFKVTEHVWWVGAIDWDVRDFHGYATRKGTTYNAFLVMGEKIALIDTVKYSHKEEMFDRIKSLIPLSKIDYIISNHAEPDHAGSLPDAIELIQPKKVFASPKGIKALQSHYEYSTPFEEAKDGSSLSLGNLTIQFVETPMLHWPDSMFSYLVEEKLLFSQDAFGMHLASSERYADEIPNFTLTYEAKKYYANILLPYSNRILALIERIKELKLEFNIVAPDHGPIWRTSEGISRIVSLYEKWAKQESDGSVVIVYDTMWKSTHKMALSIGEALIEAGVETNIMPLSVNHRSDIATKILSAKAFIVGCPVLNDNLFPSLPDVLTYLKGLKRKDLIGAYFGSYGWSPKPLDTLGTYLNEMKVEIVTDPVKVNYAPTGSDLEKCYQLGQAVLKKIQS